MTLHSKKLFIPGTATEWGAKQESALSAQSLALHDLTLVKRILHEIPFIL